MKNIALILASGTGSRCGLDYPKQFANVNGKTVLEYTLQKFQDNKNIDCIYIVTNEEYIDKVNSLSKQFSKVVTVVKGGKTRKDSSYNGISSIKETEANVLIHDGVRPFVSEEIINKCVEGMNNADALCVTIDSTDTIFEVDTDNIIVNIPQRKSLKRAQTPQCFKLSLIKKAHELAKNDDKCNVTDDCGLIMHYNLANIYTIEGSIDNIKITFKEDLEKLSF